MIGYDSFRTVFGSAYASNPNRGFVPPVTVGYKETEALGQDLDTAAQYMADAGYTAAAGSLQDWYAAHTPLIALYWDSQILVHSAAYENFTVDAVFGLNNANTWFSITAK